MQFKLNVGIAREDGKLTILTVGTDWHKQIEDSEAECEGRPYKVFEVMPNPRALAEIRKWLIGLGDSWRDADQGARAVLKSILKEMKNVMKDVKKK